MLRKIITGASKASLARGTGRPRPGRCQTFSFIPLANGVVASSFLVRATTDTNCGCLRDNGIPPDSVTNRPGEFLAARWLLRRERTVRHLCSLRINTRNNLSAGMSLSECGSQSTQYYVSESQLSGRDLKALWTREMPNYDWVKFRTARCYVPFGYYTRPSLRGKQFQRGGG